MTDTTEFLKKVQSKQEVEDNIKNIM